MMTTETEATTTVPPIEHREAMVAGRDGLRAIRRRGRRTDRRGLGSPDRVRGLVGTTPGGARGGGHAVGGVDARAGQPDARDQAALAPGGWQRGRTHDTGPDRPRRRARHGSARRRVSGAGDVGDDWPSPDSGSPAASGVDPRPDGRNHRRAVAARLSGRRDPHPRCVAAPDRPVPSRRCRTRADADHDGRIIAEVAAEWARRHGRPHRLVLTGPAGGTFTSGEPDAETIELDAVEFCRILSGRAEGRRPAGHRGALLIEIPSEGSGCRTSSRG